MALSPAEFYQHPRDELSRWQRLAVAVAETALLDLHSRQAAVRTSATRFLQTELWSCVWGQWLMGLGLTRPCVMRLVAERLAQKRPAAGGGRWSRSFGRRDWTAKHLQPEPELDEVEDPAE